MDFLDPNLILTDIRTLAESPKRDLGINLVPNRRAGVKISFDHD